MSKLAQDIESVGAELFEGRLAQDINSVDAELVQETTVLSLTAPANGQTDVTLSMTFSWNDSQNRGLYRLLYDTDINFGNPTVVWTESTSHNATLTSGTYYWKVEAHNTVQQDAFVPETTGLDSQAGDEAFLENLYANTQGVNLFTGEDVFPTFSSSGSLPTLTSEEDGVVYRVNDGASVNELWVWQWNFTNSTGSWSKHGDIWSDKTGWSTSGMDLSNPISGVTTETINGELRVTEIDLRNQHACGSIDIPEWSNIKQCTLINTTFNNLVTDYPSAIHDLGANLEYLYLNYSDDQIGGFEDLHPHEYYPATNNALAFEPGKESSQFGDNTIKGAIPSFANLTGLKGYVIAFADNFGISSRAPIEVNGVSSVPADIFDVSTMEILIIYDCWNIGGSGNTLSFPTTLNMPNLIQMSISGGSGTNWDEVDQGFMVGGYPTDLDNLPELLGWETGKHSRLKGLPDLSASVKLTRYAFSQNDFDGDTFPAYVVDGTLPEIDVVGLKNPFANPLTGTLPETWGITKADLFEIGYNNLTGTVPIGFWNIDMSKINLRHNNFTSLGVQDLSGLTSMSLLRYFNNDIGGEPIPYINFDSNQWNRIRFEANRYVFADMLYVPPNAPSGETAFELYAQMTLQTFTYNNQRPFGSVDDKSFASGTSEVLFDDFVGIYSHFANVYQWQKSTDGSTWSNLSDGGDISGAESLQLTISNIDSSDEAFYRLQVTNTLFDSICATYSLTTMTLNSNEIFLEVL